MEPTFFLFSYSLLSKAFWDTRGSCQRPEQILKIVLKGNRVRKFHDSEIQHNCNFLLLLLSVLL